MGRPRKNKVVVETKVEDTTPVTPTPIKTKAQTLHEELVKNFNGEEPSKEVSKDNKSVKNLNDILDGTSVDDMYSDAKVDPTVIISKSSIPEFENNVTEPSKAPVTEIPKDLTMVGGKQSKGDEDAPFSIAADSPENRSFAIYDADTDRLIEDIFYANRSTNVVAVFLKNDKGQPVVAETDGKKFPVLVLKNHNIYFKRNIKI